MRHGSLWVALALCFSTASAMRADIVVNTSLNLTGFTITPTTGSAQISPGVGALVVAMAGDNLGESDAEFNFNTDGPTSTSAAVSLASASASADGSLLTTSSASVNIPSLDAAVLPTQTDGNSQLSGSFEIVDTTPGTNPVDVTFDATLTGSQSLFSDPYGISADSEVTFDLALPDLDSNGNFIGDGFLFYDNPVSIGSDTTSLTTVNKSLTNTASLLTNTEYSFFLETDAESDGFDSTPEPSSLLLMATLLVILTACRLRRA